VTHLGDRVAALVDGELDHESRDRALAHIATCDACRAEVDAERRLKARIRALSEPELTADLRLRLLGVAASPASDGPPALALRRQGLELPVGHPRLFAAAAVLVVVFTLTTAFAVGGSDGSPGVPVNPAVDQYAVEHAVLVGEVPLADGYAGSGVVSTAYPSLTTVTRPETMQLLPVDPRPALLDVQPLSAPQQEPSASPTTGSPGSASPAR
jgi:anti-sigma factor RsiW